MIKKIILVSIFCSLLLSCGKKEDPQYKANKSSTLISKI
jgi:hypothetical protein